MSTLDRFLPGDIVPLNTRGSRRTSDMNAFFTSRMLVAEEEPLYWEAVKSNQTFNAKLHLVCARRASANHRSIFITIEGPRLPRSETVL